jgi:hypothetical protein
MGNRPKTIKIINYKTIIKFTAVFDRELLAFTGKAHIILLTWVNK